MNLKNFIGILIPFLLFVGLCFYIIESFYLITADQITYNKMETELKMVREVMHLEYDNDLLTDAKEIIDEAFFSTNAPVNVYRARSGGTLVGLVFMPVRAKGYSGYIDLAIGLTNEGIITGVRVNKHQETEGFGSRIHQDNSNWIQGFEQRSLHNTPQKDWAVQSDGGNFDQISGATISPRGVINAVKKTLDYHEIYNEELGE